MAVGACMTGVCAWQGVHGSGGMHDRGCVWQGAWQGVMEAGVCGRGHAWQGDMHGRRGMHGRGCAWQGCVWQILRDTVNERAVRILLECILVIIIFLTFCLNFL